MSHQSRVDKHANLYKARELAEDCCCEDVLDECPDCRPLFLALNEAEERGYDNGCKRGCQVGKPDTALPGEDVPCDHASLRVVDDLVLGDPMEPGKINTNHLETDHAVAECMNPSCRMRWDLGRPAPLTIRDRQEAISHPARRTEARESNLLPSEVCCHRCDAWLGERCRFPGHTKAGMWDPMCPGFDIIHATTNNKTTK